MSLEQLMDVEVTLVSKRPQKLASAAAAIQVITREDIRRMGIASLPEALQLASNLQVAQLTNREWAISARGFNSTAANKLLVMIDGRTVYTPLYSGVFWDAQQVFLEDVDRIEVISGPGGTLWGSNAVNGVINIVTRDASETQGAFVSVGAGSLLRDFDRARYGGMLGEDITYRVYGQRSDHDALVLADGSGAGNPWNSYQGGFRMDWLESAADRISAQGDFYVGHFRDAPNATTRNNGQNLLGRWRHAFAETSELEVQAYYDRTWRKANLSPQFAFTDAINTYDLEAQFGFPLGTANQAMIGAGYRLIQDDAENFPFFAFLPGRKDLHRFNAFVQDEISLLSRRLQLTLGTKLEREDYSGFNLQPSARAAWSPTRRQTLWTAVSRAVRTPSRIDVEFFAPEPPVPPTQLKIGGGADFESESLIAYEIGYRMQATDRFTLSVAGFYNRYDDLRSSELAAPTTVVFRNGLEADSRGVEANVRFRPTSWCELDAGYTFLDSDIWEKAGHTDLTTPHGQWNDPAHQATGRAMLDLPLDFTFSLAAFYVDELPNPRIPARLGYHAGLTWTHGNLEASIFGRNLADDHDPEFGPAKNRQEAPRSVYGMVALRI
jgi:iron complex outermembrane receptor protein